MTEQYITVWVILKLLSVMKCWLWIIVWQWSDNGTFNIIHDARSTMNYHEIFCSILCWKNYEHLANLKGNEEWFSVAHSDIQHKIRQTNELDFAKIYWHKLIYLLLCIFMVQLRLLTVEKRAGNSQFTCGNCYFKIHVCQKHYLLF